MKSILISIKPEWVAKILNGEKTIEVRKTAPKCDLPIEVYIYCTKGHYIGHLSNRYVGKVVAKFTLKNVEKIKYHFDYYDMGEWTESYILEKSCLSYDELDDYLQASKDYDESKPSPVYGYAWHIEDLVIFDEPRPLTDFQGKMIFGAKPPQSWKYIYSDEITEGE